jgi:hypothetical protein
MEYTHLGSGDYLIKIEKDKIEKMIEVMAEESYQTATLKRDFISKDGLILEDFITYSDNRAKIIGLNMGLINQRQCYTRLQRMVGGDDFIFRGKHFEKSGRNPEEFLESIVKEIEN